MKHLALLAVISLAACTAPGAGLPSPSPAGTCDAAAVQDLVGKPHDTHRAEAQRRAHAGLVRSYATGAALTMDYRADRLNIETDAGGRIVKLSCG